LMSEAKRRSAADPWDSAARPAKFVSADQRLVKADPVEDLQEGLAPNKLTSVVPP
jgi:hypothetical protein